MNKTKTKLNTNKWLVESQRNAAIIFAGSEGDARRLFHENFNGESITFMHKHKFPLVSIIF